MNHSTKVILNRAQIGRGVEGLDTTVKSSTGIGRYFAPTWDMVMSHKRGTLSDQAYTEQYEKILDGVSDQIWQELYETYKDTGELTVTCYCQNGKFCHTHLLIGYACECFPDWFEK